MLTDPAPPDLPLADIQGFVLRGYRSFVYGRHFVTVVTVPPAARALIGVLATGNSGGLRITTAAKWQVKPDYTLNIGFTYEGLEALGVSAAVLADFPPEFQSGAVGQAANIFDVGTSRPNNWVGGMGTPGNVHVIFSLFATTPESLELHSAMLRKAFVGSFCETYNHDGQALPEGRVHFGYKDGISQPALVNGPAPSHRYPEELGIHGRSPWGDFLLGYPNTFNNGSIYSPALAATSLGANASFGAFRILKQDVADFFAYLKQAAVSVNLTPEQIAAKLLGRWSNGVPLALSPDSDAPIPDDRLNMFLYKGVADGQANPDPFGTACPIGAHIRRGNPRDEIVQGGFTQQARIIRRNLSYGKEFDPANPNDGIERGLIGYFINADFANQFQFLMSTWMNSSAFAGGQITGADPLIGDNGASSSEFFIPTSNKTHLTLTGFARFVITRGSAYCFLPGIQGLSCLAAQSC
jgi:deferrochelatase/peroxidase EfeB